MRGWVLDLLFPPKCLLCGGVLENGEIDLCRGCRKEAPEYPGPKSKLPFLDSYAAVWYYKENIRRSILRYKFQGKRNMAAGFGRILAMKLQSQYPEGTDLLTWIPVSRIRKFRRGYDQAELLARAVGRELGMTPVPLLKKIRNNPPQSGISDDAMRRANVLGAYRIRRDTDVAGKRIWLLDDILTTGATAGECARILKTAGACEVCCATVAAAEKRNGTYSI